MWIQLNIISGLMFGVEFLWGMSTMVVDLGIFRIYIGIAKFDDEE